MGMWAKTFFFGQNKYPGPPDNINEIDNDFLVRSLQ